MSDVQAANIQYFVIIANQKQKNTFLSLLNDYNAHVIQTVYGHGSMSPSALAAAFGFEAEQGKVLITSLIKNDSAKTLIDVLFTDYKFNKPNTGIAFSIPVESLSF